MELIANRYRVLQKLGQGGMGAVYRVADTSQGDREVALKLLEGARTGDSDAARSRFKEEFQTMVKLKHPNTIHVHDYGMAEGQPYLTMEIVEGQELTELIGKLDWQATCGILIQLTQALGFIHSRCYVHRDIKPENIRVTEDGTVKLMDFGLMEQLGLPATGKIVGTIAYLPPEVAGGGVIDASSDLYSVGCLAYELLTGQQPFHGDSVLEVIKAHMNQAPRALSALNPEVPKELEDIVLQLLEKNHAYRFRSANELIQRLSQFSGVAILGENVEQRKSYLNSGVLVARDAELAAIKSGLDQARAGGRSAFFVSAPAGIGKSRLLHELKLHAQLNEVPFHTGQCAEGISAPYEPLAQALSLLLPMTTADEVAEFGPVLVKLLPALAARGVAPAEPLPEAGQERVRLYETVNRWLGAVAKRQPFVLFIDDIHWADSPSLDMLNAILRGGGAGFMVIAAFRSDEVTASSPIWYTVEEQLTTRIELAPFDAAQTKALFEAMLTRTQLSEACLEHLFQATAGNPFFLTEILRYMIEEDLLQRREGTWVFPDDVKAIQLPDSVQATIIRRMGQLSATAKQLVVLCAAVGKRQDRQTLLQVSGLPEAELFGAIDELVEKQFLLRVERGFAFPHDRLREALLAHASEAEFQGWHLRIGEHLETRHATSLEGVIPQLAYHFARSGNEEKAFDYLYRAGGLSFMSGGINEAVDFWVEAERRLQRVAHPQKETLQIELWHNIGLLAWDSKPFIAIEVLRKEIAFLEGLGDIPSVVAEFKRQVAELKKLPPEESAPIFAELDVIRPYVHNEGQSAPPDFGTLIPRLVEAKGFLACALCLACEYGNAFELGAQAMDLLPDPDMWASGIVNVAIGGTGSHSGRLRTCYECGTKSWAALKDRQKSDHPGIPIFKTWALLFMNATGWVGLPVNPEYDEMALAIARENQIPHMEGWSYFYIGYRDVITGRYASFYEKLNMGVQAHRRAGAVGMGMLHLICGLAQGLIERGDFNEALSLIRQAIDVNQIESELYTECWIHVLKGHVSLAANQLAEAEQLFRLAIAQSDEGRWMEMKGRLGLAMALNRLGRPEEARQEARIVLEMAEGDEFFSPYKQSIARRLMGESARLAGDPAEAKRFLSEARALAEAQDNPIQLGFSERALGQLAEAEGDRVEARARFQAALKAFQSIDNQYQIRQVLPSLRELETEQTAVVPAAEIKRQARDKTVTDIVDRLTLMTKSFDGLSVSSLSLNDETLSVAGPELSSFYGALLKECATAVNAQTGSFYAVEEPGGERLRWVASLDGSEGDDPVFNPQIAKDALAEASGVCVIDLPSDGDMMVGSQIDFMLRCVIAAPLRVGDQACGIVYLTKEDLNEPFQEAELELTSGILAHLGERLGMLSAT